MSIHPNGTAEQIVLDLSAQRLDQLLRSSKLERDHVDDNVCVKASDPRAEFALGFFGLAVHSDLFDSFPGRMLFIGRCRATADVYNRVPTLDKLGHEVGSHMSISSNDDDPSHGFFLRLSTFHCQLAYNFDQMEEVFKADALRLARKSLLELCATTCLFVFCSAQALEAQPPDGRP